MTTRTRTQLLREEEAREEVSCFNCAKSHKVSRSADSTICPYCSTYIGFGDVEIREQRTSEVRTHGDVLVKKGATLVGGVSCRNLKVYGKVLGRIRCTEQAAFLASSRVLRPVSCGRLLIGKKAKLHFSHPITVEEAEIRGEAHGEFTCLGRFHVGKRGMVYGAVAAKAIVVDAGGCMVGELRIIKEREAIRRFGRTLAEAEGPTS